MAANKFQFKILNSATPQADYDALTKDAMTFYLLNTGVGYFGSIPLFGGGANSTVVISTTGAIGTLEAGKIYFVTVDGVTDNNTTSPQAIPQGVYSTDGTTVTDLTAKGIATWIANNAVKDMTASGYTPADTELPTAKAVADYVDDKMSGSSILQAQFFRKVESYTITADDIAGTSAMAATGKFTYGSAVEGEVGLLFTKDDDMNDDLDSSIDSNESYYFISLKGYIDIYTVKDTDSIKMTQTDGANEFSAELNVSATETSIIVDTNGVSLNKATSINDGDGVVTDDEGTVIPIASDDRLVTEKALVDYFTNTIKVAIDDAIADALADVVTYTIES